jgi:hypothetical protein
LSQNYLNIKNYVETLKKGGYTIVGYVRKSLGKANNRLLNLQNMVMQLQKRSFVDKCFVSISCEASSDITARDLNQDPNALKEIKGIQGNTQGIYFYYAYKYKH